MKSKRRAENMKKTILFLAAFAALVSCVKEAPVQEPEVVKQTIVFEAVAPSSSDESEADSKTTLVDHSLVHWSNGDQVKVGFFPNVNSGQNTVNNLNGVFTATFDEETSSKAWFSTDSWSWDAGNGEAERMYRSDAIAVYPSSATVYSRRVGTYDDANTEISYDLPAEQTAVLNSFQSGVNFSYAKVQKSEFVANAASLSFINACALLKITLPATATNVASVEITSKDNVALAGKFAIPDGSKGSYKDTPWSKANTDGTLNFSVESGNPVVVLSAAEGQMLQAGGSYYVVVWPGAHNSGLDFLFTNAEGATAKKSVAAPVTFTRAKVETFNFKSDIDFVKESILEVNQTTLGLNALNGSSAEFTVNANYDWTATSDQSWLTVSPASGEASLADQTVTISATENDSPNNRTATVTVKDETGSTKTISVTQQAPQISISMYYSDSEILLTDTWNFVKVTSNVAWKLSADQDWVTIQETTGSATSGTKNVKVTFPVNTDTSPKSVTFTITNQSGTISKTVTMTLPAPKKYYIVSQVTEASQLENDGLYVIEFQSYSNYFWKVDANGNVVRTSVTRNNGFEEDYVFRFEKTAYGNPDAKYQSYSTGHLWSVKLDKYFNWYNLNFGDGHKTDLVFLNKWGNETGYDIDIIEHYEPYRTIYWTGSKLQWGTTSESNRKWYIHKVELR